MRVASLKNSALFLGLIILIFAVFMVYLYQKNYTYKETKSIKTTPVVESVKKEVTPPQNPTENIGQNPKPDSLKKSSKEVVEQAKPLEYTLDAKIEKPIIKNSDYPSEVELILQEQKKLDALQKKTPLEKKAKEWEVDYSIGLEEGAIDEFKEDNKLRPEMLNGKVGFSKSF